MTKKKILFVGEYSQVATGFANIGRYLLGELYAKHSDKYEIAELACYLPENHPHGDLVPWKVYGNQPSGATKEVLEIFNSNPAYQMGLWSFGKALLDFQPDIVVSWRDPWFDNFIHEHPYRRFFKFVHMPTCDGTPQKYEWLYEVMGADLVLTYSFWAKNVLEKESGGKIQVFDVASPPIDSSIFKPLDKNLIRQSFGIPTDAIVFGACMRNQPRKLFPELMRGFNRYLDLCKKNNRQDLINKSYLYFHTTYPDLGWDFSSEIKRHHLGHKILFTYTCECGLTYPLFFSGESTYCRNCNRKKSEFPSTGQGVTREVLANIYNSWDLLVQPSICLEKNQEIQTDCGWKKISNINIGDRVLTSNGFNKVVDVIENDGSHKDMVSVKVVGKYDELICTSDHPLLGYNHDISTHNKTSLREEIGSKITQNVPLPDPYFIEAGKLNNGDILFSYIDDEEIDQDKHDLSNYITNSDNYNVNNNYIQSIKSTCHINRYLDIDEEYCRFLGMFLGDGCATSGSVKITVSDKENENIDLAKKFLSKIDNRVSIRKYNDRSALDIMLHSCVALNYFKQFYNENRDKIIPNWVAKLPKRKQLELVRGLIMADGSIHSTKRNTDITIICNTSKPLMDSIIDILHRLRIPYGSSVQNRKNNRKAMYRIEIYGNLLDQEPNLKTTNHSIKYIGNKIIRVVKSVEITNKEEKVYDLTIEGTHNFQTKLCIAHNCEGFGMPINEAKACGIPCLVTDHSAMIEQGNSPGGMIIPVTQHIQEPQFQTSQIRAWINPDVLGELLFNFACLSNEEKKQLSDDACKFTHQNYSIENITSVWCRAFDAVNVDDNPNWDTPAEFRRPTINNIPYNLPICDFVKWCYYNILQEPEKYHTYNGYKSIQILERGFDLSTNEQGLPKKEPISQETFVKFLINKVHSYNLAEKERIQHFHPEVNKQIKVQEI